MHGIRSGDLSHTQRREDLLLCMCYTFVGSPNFVCCSQNEISKHICGRFGLVVSRNVISEGEKTELSVRRLVQGSRSDACPVLIGRQSLPVVLTVVCCCGRTNSSGVAADMSRCTHFWMPNVKDTRIGGTHHFYRRSHVLSIKHYIFASPADDLLVETTNFEEVWSRMTERIYRVKTIQLILKTNLINI